MCEFADFDLDGICDDVDDCVGLYDACGVCNGPDQWPIVDADIPVGDCDATETRLMPSAHVAGHAQATSTTMAFATTSILA